MGTGMVHKFGIGTPGSVAGAHSRAGGPRIRVLAASILAALAVVAVVGTLARPATAAATAPARVAADPPLIPGGNLPGTGKAVSTSMNSLNWAGYGVTGRAGTLTSVQATFVVPALQSCGSQEVSASSFWAGIDGLGTGTVEQDGVDASCDDGVSQYTPWYEIYPQSPVVFTHLAVNPGDTMQAAVTSEGSSAYKLRLVDVTTGASASTTVTLRAATNASAECIAEDPGNTPVPYADYGSASFTGCTVNGSAIGTHSPSPITTVSSDGTPVAVPSALQGNQAFTVTREITTSGSSSAPAPATAPAPAPAPAPSPGPLAGPVVGMASTPSGNGYWLVNAAGGVSPHGGARFYGSMAAAHLNSPIAHIVSTSDGLGYWLVAGDGGVFAFGDAGFFGSMGGLRLNAPVVDVAPTTDDRGYWLAASDGGIFAFGDARFWGSMGGRRLNDPVVGISADAQTGGYRLVASDGGIFAFGAPFFGSTGSLRLAKPIVSMADAAPASGYWFVAADGGVFAFGAPFHGSGGGQPIPAAVVGMAGDAATGGYWLVGAGGAVYSFDAPFYGAD